MGIESRLNPNARDVQQAHASGVLDARGRPLREGDELILSTRNPIYFRVAQITPNLDPELPPGLFLVHVACIATFRATGGRINLEFIRVRTAEEAGPQAFTLLDAAPDPQEKR